MCGIAGIHALRPDQAVDPREIATMLATMPYRGPDACGISLVEPYIGLGHLRLAILDLRPESNQPFTIEDGNLVLTYNGEIFNYVELREELAALGHSFHTTSDTEVLIRAYREWGESAVLRFNGMWAFALYDRARRTLFCARDRFGIKPFNYAITPQRFVFASEIKAILAVEPSLASPDYDSLSRILRASIGARSAATCFAGIRRLPPAHCLTITDGQVQLRRYWDYPPECEQPPSYKEAADKVRQLLVRGIQFRMRSDVPVGLTLSGGVDSSSIACLLKSDLTGHLDTFTASYQGESYDESPRAYQLATSLGLDPHLIPAQPFDFLKRLREIIWHLESPTHTPAVFPLWNIATAAKERVTVLLEGQGADELLAGYRLNFIDALIDRQRSGHVLASLVEFRWAYRLYGAKFAAQLAGRRINPPRLHKWFRIFRGDEQVYIGALADRVDKPESTRHNKDRDGRLNQSLIQQMEGRLVDLLHYGDAISMAHSLESRLPFLDHDLVDYCVSLPGEYKFRDGRGKAILREAVRHDVPAHILDDRKKLGFPTPIARWFREDPEHTIYPVLLGSECQQRGLFDTARLKHAIERHRQGKLDLSNNIYRWIMTELWFQVFIDGAATRQPAALPAYIEQACLRSVNSLPGPDVKPAAR